MTQIANNSNTTLMDQSKHSTDMERPFNPCVTNLWGKKQ